jgi:hypothetical protein
MTPTVESMHPASGGQHLRLTHDPTTRTNFPGFGVAVSAHYPRTADLSVRPIAPNTVSLDIAISAPGGMDFRVQPQSNSQGLPSSYALFHYMGGIYLIDDCVDGNSANWFYSGFDWDTTGGYQNYTVAKDPCLDTFKFYYNGVLIHESCIGVYWGTNLEQLLVFGDNYPGSTMDVDNVVLESGNGCVCGDGVVSSDFAHEDCEPTSDDNCPGRCIPPGEMNECHCTPICTQAAPCPVDNGANGPFVTSSGYYIYTGNPPFVSVDGCGTDFDARLSIGTTSSPIVSNLNCNQGSNGENSDPSASCYTASGSEPDPCACIANPGEPILIQLATSNGSVPLGSSSIVNIRKKSVCAGPSVGTCCDTNGPDQGCTENATEADCSGADKVWTDQGKCVDVICDCIPDCTGLICGDDGCGGSCGTCDDGIACTIDSCSEGTSCLFAPSHAVCSNNNVCDGNEQCDG